MSNLINQDSAGNTFYNYITPVVKGSSTLFTHASFNNYVRDALGAVNIDMTTTSWSAFRFPAPGIETRTAQVVKPGTEYDVSTTNRFSFGIDRTFHTMCTNNGTTGTTGIFGGVGTIASAPAARTLEFAVINSYSLCLASFNGDLSVASRFVYLGWLREPVYTGEEYPRGLTSFAFYNAQGAKYNRPTVENLTTETLLSSAANSITSPLIVCTPGTDPGDDSETFTDIVIRDAADPYNPVGKLWNCIDMPATCNVGELWRNAGAYDGDGTASEQDVYLCIMPWGTRKLGMRVWTENVN